MKRSTISRGFWALVTFRVGILLLLLLAVGLLWLSNLYFTAKYTEETRSEADKQVSLYSGRIASELQRMSVVPLLLAQDSMLIDALTEENFVATTQRLISYTMETGAKSITLYDAGGRVVAASNRHIIGRNDRDQPYVVDALRSKETVFSEVGIRETQLGFFYARQVQADRQTIGVISVEVDLERLLDRWSGARSTIMVTNSSGIVILSTERQFLHQTEEKALSNQPTLSAVQRAIRATGEWSQTVADAYIRGEPLFRLESKIPFQGWRLVYLASFQDVRARVNGILAVEIMGFALLAALAFYILSRRAIRQSFLFKAETAELRRLNRRLSEEMAARQRVERDLEVAEQSLAQSSKLAALGEMSAAVSHELNQPLAAMKTYLAGAKLLLQRQRKEEALTSFQRIDDLIGRMGSITKQLKSYARKGGDELVPLDFRNSVKSSLSMMAPQLGQQQVEVSCSLPSEPVMVMGDAVRLEQVIINLLRNGVDATKLEEQPAISITLLNGEMAQLSVRDNGPGIENLSSLFEPFYTTKEPGEGVGLGLAISSGIAKDLGGRLLARNGSQNGAIFEFLVPTIKLEETRHEAAE